jgi:hypothetical protein
VGRGSKCRLSSLCAKVPLNVAVASSSGHYTLDPIWYPAYQDKKQLVEPLGSGSPYYIRFATCILTSDFANVPGTNSVTRISTCFVL